MLSSPGCVRVGGLLLVHWDLYNTLHERAQMRLGRPCSSWQDGYTVMIQINTVYKHGELKSMHEECKILEILRS